MALHFFMRVNGQPVGLVYIQRLNDRVIPGHPSQYLVEIECPPHTKPWETTVEHLYEEGALVLVYKALGAVLKLQRKPRRRTSRPTQHT